MLKYLTFPRCKVAGTILRGSNSPCQTIVIFPVVRSSGSGGGRYTFFLF